MVFIGGPRQSGKTTLAKHLCMLADCDIQARYLNWDAATDREKIIKETFPAGPGFLILDEIHKYSRWRQVVKGLFDKRREELQILVTGSARLDYYRRGGYLLQGRDHPIGYCPDGCPVGGYSQSTVKDLMIYGGFPEPFRMQSGRQTRRWSREYRSRVIQGDLSDLENVQDLGMIESLAIRLPNWLGLHSR